MPSSALRRTASLSSIAAAYASTNWHGIPRPPVERYFLTIDVAKELERLQRRVDADFEELAPRRAGIGKNCMQLRFRDTRFRDLHNSLNRECCRNTRGFAQLVSSF